MADEAAVVEEGGSPLVAVSFQRNSRRKEKYLEAEPKALGITQIGMSVFQIICVSVFLASGVSRISSDVAFFISSLLVVIAGCVAVAAQNLHVPTLRACMGMEIVAIGASLFNLINALVKLEDAPYSCWNYYHENSTLNHAEICQSIMSTHSHFYAESMLIQAVLLSISVTLSIYCCKIINCCTPAPKMTVITVQAPAVQQ